MILIFSWRQAQAKIHRKVHNWAKCHEYNEPIYTYKVSVLNEVLKKFYVEVRKKDGSSYEPNCFHKPPFENYEEKGFKNAK